MVRTDGVRVDELLFQVSKAVYSAMASSQLTVLRWTFDQGKKAILSDIPEGIESQGYAGWIFLLLIGEDPQHWPMNYSNLKHYGILDGLGKLAGEIKSQNASEVDEMLKLRERLFSGIDHRISMIEEQRHKMSFQHGCEYL